MVLTTSKHTIELLMAVIPTNVSLSSNYILILLAIGPICSLISSAIFGAAIGAAFGVAPALVMYQWALSGLGKLGWLAAFIYTAGTADGLAEDIITTLSKLPNSSAILRMSVAFPL